jgi:hypothetical protein
VTDHAKDAQPFRSTSRALPRFDSVEMRITSPSTTK